MDEKLQSIKLFKLQLFSRLVCPLSLKRGAGLQAEKDREQRMRGVGLNLYGLPNFGMVGRVGRENALWSALDRARKKKQVEIVFVEGPSGSGKSALARWLGERAELGVAQILCWLHAIGASSDGFVRCWLAIGRLSD